MSTKEKPKLFNTNTRALCVSQSDQTPSEDHCQCPYCGFTGSSDLFEHEWTLRLRELVVKHASLGITPDLQVMNIQDARYLYNWLCRRNA